MKILWVGDAVVSSGFAKCTHAVCDHLVASGHEVAVLGINYFGDPHDYPYRIHPCYHPQKNGKDAFGVYRLGDIVTEEDPDIIVFLNDPWNIPSYMAALKFAQKKTGIPIPYTVGWLAVDAKNQRKDAVNDLDHVVVWTEFAKEEIRASGYTGPCSIVPLGVDHSVFYPMDKAECRARISFNQGREGSALAPDDFVVGVVGRNQMRKRLDLSISYFADVVNKYGIDNAQLLLQVAPTNEDYFSLSKISEYYGVRDRVHISEGALGSGLDESVMPVIYSTLDVYLTTTQGEGFGLPTLEAMACGVPCVVPDWSGLGSWTGDAALKIPCTSTAITAPMGDPAYTIGGIPDQKLMTAGVAAMRPGSDLCNRHRERGLKLASELAWESVAPKFRAVLESISNSAKAAAGR